MSTTDRDLAGDVVDADLDREFTEALDDEMDRLEELDGDDVTDPELNGNGSEPAGTVVDDDLDADDVSDDGELGDDGDVDAAALDTDEVDDLHDVEDELRDDELDVDDAELDVATGEDEDEAHTVDLETDVDVAGATELGTDVDEADTTDDDVDARDNEDDDLDPDALDADTDDADTDDADTDDADARADADDEPFELPEIVMATEPEPADGDVAVEAREGDFDDLDDPDVSEDVLEELRRADIDGPTVDYAPQDDTTSARRRPKRSPDFDPAPMPIPTPMPRVLGRKPRVRKVTRVVRHVDPWSVFKIALVANIVLYVILLTAGVLLWNVANATGTVENVERFFESFGWSSFEFNGGQIYHSAWVAGIFVVIGMTGLAVLAATLFNLITDLVGGVRFTVLEEEVVERRASPMRRFVVRRPEPEVPAVIEDESGPIVREAVVDDSGAIIRRSR